MSVIVPPEAAETGAGPLLPARSLTALPASLNITVPAEQEETETTIDEPELEAGLNTQPVAVPVLLKSAAVKPVMASEKARV